MKKVEIKKPHMKKTPLSKAFEAPPRGARGPEAFHKKPSPPPFGGRSKAARGKFTDENPPY